MNLLLRHVVLSVTIAVAAGAAAQETFITEFEVAGLSCDGCAATATEALRKLPGVRTVIVEFASRSARVESSKQISETELRNALARFGFEARFPNDEVIAPLTPEERSRLDIKVVSRGEAFDIQKHLARGKFTIFDFWAEWCGPCHVLTPKIERFVQSTTNAALRTIDLKEWNSAAGKQATKEFRIPALPYVRVYGPDGRFLGAVVGNDIDKIKKLVGAN